MTPAALAARAASTGGLSVGRAFDVDAVHSCGSRTGRLAEDGWVELAAVVPPALCQSLLAAAAELRRAELPLTALYVFDEVWELGAAIARAMGADYALAPDAWTFWVPPGEAGWPPHRGVYAPLDRAAPQCLNAWIALSDVEVDRSCIHVVPLADDPAYARGALDDVAVPVGKARALPVSAGTALVWNANVLHWGGASSPTAVGPRVSITFTLLRQGVREGGAGETLDLAQLDPWKRLDLVAAQILTYGERDRSITASAKAWAAITSAITSQEAARRPGGTMG